MSETENDNTGFSLEGRVMCSDDACIGVVGNDGKCKVCGLVYEGDEVPEEAPDEPRDSSEIDSKDTQKPPDDNSGGGDGGSYSNDRVCCPDDTCIGIIGSNGKCGTCGRDGSS